jgi:hypothetical protein
MHIFFIIAFVQNETRDRFFCELKVSDNFCGNCATIVPLVITLTFLVNYCIGVQKSDFLTQPQQSSSCETDQDLYKNNCLFGRRLPKFVKIN